MIVTRGILLFLLAVAATLVRAEPGFLWRMEMEMNGMALPGMGGGTTQCLPAGRSDTPGMDDSRCKLLESKRTGNSYHWKARCDGTVSRGDFTYLGDTAYKGTVTVEEGGEKMTMKMAGKRLGKCEYFVPRAVMPDMTAECDQIVRELEPSMVFGPNALCAKRRKDFCARFGDLGPEAYGRVHDRVKNEERMGAMNGMVKMSEALKKCGYELSELKGRQCARATQAKDCDFLRRYCDQAEQLAACPQGREFSGRAYTAAAATGSGPGSPLGEGLNRLKGLFGF